MIWNEWMLVIPYRDVGENELEIILIGRNTPLWKRECTGFIYIKGRVFGSMSSVGDKRANGLFAKPKSNLILGTMAGEEYKLRIRVG